MPSSPLTVTPGKSWVSTDAATVANLNATAKPVVVIPDGAIDAEQLSASGLNALRTGGNLFDNADFSRWTRTTSVSAAATASTFAADWWLVRPAGAAVTYERAAAGPSNNKTYYCAKITGASSVTTVDLGQRRALRLGTTLRQGMALSVWIYNGTGATFTPVLAIYTADGADNFGAVTQRLTTNFDVSATNGAWTECTVTVTAASMAALTNINNGAEVCIRIPSGSLDSGGKYVQVAQADLRSGTTVGVFNVDRVNDQEEGSTSSTSDQHEYARNPNFARWITTSVTTTAGEDEVSAWDWYVNSAGAGVVLSRDTTVPSNESYYSLKITGAASVNAVDIIHKVEGAQAAELRKDISIGLYIYNGTGADFAPDINIDVCDSLDNFESVTNGYTTTATTCADGGWTRITLEIDGSTITNIERGFRLVVQVPSGSLDGAGKYVHIAQAALRPGTGETGFSPVPVPRYQMAGPGASGVLIEYATGSTLTCSTGRIVLVSDAGHSIALRSIASATLNIATTGANALDTGTVSADTWYAIHAICTQDGTSAGFLASTSATDPVLPDGYRYWVQIGWARYITVGFRWFVQRGNIHNYAQTTLHSGTFGATTPQTHTITSAMVPSSGVASYFGQVHVTSANGMAIAIGPDTNAVNGSWNVQAQVGTALGSTYAAADWEVVPHTAGTIYSKVASTTPTYYIYVTGFRLSL